MLFYENFLYIDYENGWFAKIDDKKRYIQVSRESTISWMIVDFAKPITVFDNLRYWIFRFLQPYPPAREFLKKELYFLSSTAISLFLNSKRR